MIRPATPGDAAQAIPLLAEAWGSNLILALTGADDMTEAQRILARLFAASGNRISYENALVDGRDGQIIGLLIAYHGRDEPMLVQPMIDTLRAQTNDPAATIGAKAAPDEFYLDTVSVRADWRGRGIGTALLQTFERQAHSLGHSRLSLLVDRDNDAARRLYERQGYRADGTVNLAGHTVWHMVKTLD